MPVEDQPREGTRRHGAGIFLGALDGGLDLRHLAGHLGLGEGRRQDDLGDEVEPQGQVLLLSRHRDGDAVAVGPGLDAATHELDGRIELGPGALRGPPRQHRTRQIGQPGAIGRIIDGAGPGQDAHGHDGHGRPLGDEQDDAVGQDFPVGERCGVGRPARGDARQGRAARQPQRAARAAAPPGSELDSGSHHDFGKSTPTLFLSGANQVRATRVRSAAVIARTFARKESLSAKAPISSKRASSEARWWTESS